MISGTMHIEGQVGGHGHKLNWLTAHNVRQSSGTITNSISVDQIVARRQGTSAMPADLVKQMTLRELRDLVVFLASLK